MIYQVDINYEIRSKPFDVFYRIKRALRQTVEKVKTNDSQSQNNIYLMKFEKLDPGNLANLISMNSKVVEKSRSNNISAKEAAWKNLRFRCHPRGQAIDKQPVYAVDIRDSLFPDNEPWNMDKFDKEHSLIHNRNMIGDNAMKGIQSSYLLVGQPYAWFCVHCEDCDVASINYLHNGGNKHWFCIPKSEGHKIEKLILDSRNYDCNTVYRHKCFILDEQTLINNGIRYYKAIQKPGQIMISLYAAFHFGWNEAFNVCEAMNIASPRYRQFHTKAELCPPNCIEFHENSAEISERFRLLLDAHE